MNRDTTLTWCGEVREKSGNKERERAYQHMEKKKEKHERNGNALREI